MPILLFANKMDLEGALSAAECSNELELHNIKDRPWQICACTALTGQGLSDGIAWLMERL